MKWPCKWVTEVTTAERKACDIEGAAPGYHPSFPKKSDLKNT